MVKLNIQCDNGATCFDSTESSSGSHVLDLHKECTTHCGIPNAYNNEKIKYKNIDYSIFVLYFFGIVSVGDPTMRSAFLVQI